MRLITMLLIALMPTLASSTPVASPATPLPTELPFTITNGSARDVPIYVYVLGVDLTSGDLGYVQDGQFTAWTLPETDVPEPAPNVAIAGPADGDPLTLDIPTNFSGRIYLAYGETLTFQLVQDGLVQPAPWNADDPNADILFDWVEFTYNDYGLWLNSSQVDQFAIPHVVGVTGADGNSTTAGAMPAGGRERVAEQIETTPGFEQTVIRDAEGNLLRVLSPGKATDVGLMPADYLDTYIDAAWAAYADSPLRVVPFAHEPETIFTGRTEGYEMIFTDTTGAEVARFAKPSTADVWECDGALDAPNDHVVGPIARTLCAALQRGTLGEYDQEPVLDPTAFYQRETTNHYARIIHGEMADGRAYAFAFDDVAGQESLVHSAAPVSASIIIPRLDE